MIFSEEFILSLKDDPTTGAKQLINTARDYLSEGEGWDENDNEVLIEAYALLLELIESNLLNINEPNITLTGHYAENCTIIFKWLNEVEKHLTKEATSLRLGSLRSRFKTSLGTAFHYEFSQGDLEKIQTSLNQLRDLVAQSTHFEQDHQRRLLKRLESLQLELHKRVSDLDKFWGLIGDAGVVLGKFGKEAKPFVDRIKEIADIVWRTQSRAEELPSGTSFPLLDDKDNKTD